MSGNLRPAWKGGRGFQPPPTVSGETRARSSSISGDSNRGGNKFSALQDDDDFQVVSGKKGRSNHHNNNHDGDPKTNSRGEAFRSSFGPGGRSSKPGRSLADLAARVPEGMSRAQSTGAYGGSGAPGGGPPGGRRYSEHLGGGRSASSGDPAVDAIRNEPSEYKKAVEAAKVIRYTREKLMAIRPRPVMGQPFPPPHLAHIDANAAVLFSEEPQDPVCWDTLDADEIWATVPTRRSSMPMPKPGGVSRVSSTGGIEEGGAPEGRRRSYVAPSSGRWQRGQALPPSEEGKRGKDKDANSPDDLWDDPVGGATGAAMDFSAFGGMPQGDLKGETGSVGSGDAFDFEKMAEASKKFEAEFRGAGDGGAEDESELAEKRVDPKRPLAMAGTTIRSGSGDDVNVFEDFDAPGAEEAEGLAPSTVQPALQPDAAGGNGAEEASSRLMAMIGVKKDDSAGGILAGIKSEGSGDDNLSPWNGGGAPATDPTAGLLGLGPATSSTAIPLNPWGDPILPTPAQPTQQNMGIGMDLASRLESFAAEQKAREAAEMEQKELLRRRQEQEEQQRRAMQQQQAQERARQQAQYNQNQNPQQNQNQQQQTSSPQSQVELVLMERITTILENSWGRSDLMSILSTLHAEDSRVIPLLSNVDLLRDLIAHNPRRVALRQDQAFGAEMAVLQMTNAQWQQHEQQVRAQQQQQQEELRRQEQLRMENIQRQRSMSNDGPPRVNPEAPWFYSDPQGNIQGPFRGDEMRQWLEAGYFKGDLPISQQAGGPFIALSVIFPQIEVAFKVQQPDRAQEEAEARARAEEDRMMEERRLEEQRMEQQRLEERRLEEQRLAEMRLEEERKRAAEDFERQRLAEEQAKKEQEAREALEQERQAKEAAAAQQAAAAAAADNSNGANQSSTQLKMMLGLSSSQQAEQDAQAVEKQVAAKSNNNGNNNQKRAKEPASTPQAPPPAAKPVASAWGNAGQNATNTRKSMSEIQKEEARRAAVVAMQQGPPVRQSSSGWANVAATASGAWAPGAVKPASAAAVVAGGAAPVGGRMVAQPAAARAKAAVMRKGSTGAPLQRGSVASTTAAEEFGASMSPDLENWCKDQMNKLNGTDDLTLVSFCMTLNDAVEIRQYLTTYLGSTPAVNNFATEFISKKGGGAAKEEEWATPGSAKKGRKKKGAATR